MQGVNHDQLVEMMVGRKMTIATPDSKPATASVPLLQIRNLSCAAAGLHDLNLQIQPGEILGLGGLVGAGRTELARVLFGITPTDSGTILLNNQPVQIRSPRDAIAHGIAYLPEDRRRHGVILPMPIEQNMTMAIQSRMFPGGWIRRSKERALANEFIESLSIKTAGPSAPVSSLSGGNQQKVALARWLATRPRVLILDEPTQGVDIGAKSEIHHFSLSHRVAVLRAGLMVQSFESAPTPQQVLHAALGYPQREEVA
jgi:rhamnose transport system ATP-binding protein